MNWLRTILDGIYFVSHNISLYYFKRMECGNTRVLEPILECVYYKPVLELW